MTITFNGIRFDWIATKGTTVGKADVKLDGVFERYREPRGHRTAYQQDVWTTGFVPYGVHTVVITYNSTNTQASTSTSTGPTPGGLCSRAACARSTGC